LSDDVNHKLNILHLLSTSLPKLSGYAIRSHNILKFQQTRFNPYALTAPISFHTNKIDVIDGIKYYRYPFNPGIKLFAKPKISKQLRIDKLYNYFYHSLFKKPVKFLRTVATHLDVNVIHGHSTEQFAKYGEIVAKERKIPFIYEIRGFLEDTHVGLGTIQHASREYNIRREKETSLMRKANLVVTLGEAMRNDIIKRGIDKRKIKIIPNGVNTEILKPKSVNMGLKKDLGLERKKIVGYIGSVRRIEGIEYLLKAVSLIQNKEENIFLLIVGPYDPIYYNELKRFIVKLGITNRVIFTGTIPNSYISQYYSIIDIIVIPRKNLRVNRLVTPLKPLEAMAMERVLLTSDLPALKEMVNLADKILKYLKDSHVREQLGKKARIFVKKNFEWRNLIKNYFEVYERIIK